MLSEALLFYVTIQNLIIQYLDILLLILIKKINKLVLPIFFINPITETNYVESQSIRDFFYNSAILDLL